MVRLHVNGGGGVERGIESSADSITNDSSLGSSLVVKLISKSYNMKVKESSSHTPTHFVHVYTVYLPACSTQ